MHQCTGVSLKNEFSESAANDPSALVRASLVKLKFLNKSVPVLLSLLRREEYLARHIYFYMPEGSAGRYHSGSMNKYKNHNKKPSKCTLYLPFVLFTV